MIAPALITLSGTMVWTGDFDEGERWLQRTAQALQTDAGPDIRLLQHIVSGMLHACRGRHHEALAEFSAAEHLQSQLAGSHTLASQVTGWLIATQARLGRLDEARAALAALPDERASSGEIANARAVTRLAEGDPAAALDALGMFWTARHRSSATSRSSSLTCWPDSLTVSSVTWARRAGPPSAHWPSPRRIG